MLTVTVGFDWSGKSSTRRPLASRYSVMPSTEVTRSTPRGSATPACAAALLCEGRCGARDRRGDQIGRNQRRGEDAPRQGLAEIHLTSLQMCKGFSCERPGRNTRNVTVGTAEEEDR